MDKEDQGDDRTAPRGRRRNCASHARRSGTWKNDKLRSTWSRDRYDTVCVIQPTALQLLHDIIGSIR